MNMTCNLFLSHDGFPGPRREDDVDEIKTQFDRIRSDTYISSKRGNFEKTDVINLYPHQRYALESEEYAVRSLVRRYRW